jgi:crotonobetainyl-CoA:carnitine CoA-transferase CaiB-like acyl-CoA transferase
VRGPVTFSDTTNGPVGAVPGLGEHTDEVLGELT